jgi:6-phosphogluconolactonase
MIMQRDTWTRATAALLALPCFWLATSPAAHAGVPTPGWVYTSTNVAGPNEVIRMARGVDGSLTPNGGTLTGGTGSGDALGSQGAVCLSADLNWLLVVNAGSNDVSVFQLVGGVPTLTDREPSLGLRPISVAMLGTLVYVLNAGSPNNVSGFKLDVGTGDLSPIPSSTYTLSAAQTGPAQVAFSPDGAWLVVTEKMTNLIDVFPTQANGQLGPIQLQPSSGQTPFGFGFRNGNQLIVSEAFMGATDASAVTSYALGSGGALSTVSASVPTTETAACWIAIPNNMLWAYATNTGSDSVSGFLITPGGTLVPLNADGVTATTGPMPTDVVFGRDTRMMFVLNSGAASISSYRIQPGGALLATGTFGSLPPMSTVGLAAY